MPSISGNTVRAYDQERCICELIKDRKKYEVQNFQTAVKEYMAGKGKNLSRLVEYAEKTENQGRSNEICGRYWYDSYIKTVER